MAKNKFGKWEITNAEFDRELTEASKRGDESLRTGLVASQVNFDQNSGMVVVHFNNGCVFGFPPELVNELQNADAKAIGEVEVTPQGTGLHWKSLDADYSVAGLLNGVFGTRAFMKELGKRGGQAKSRAKTEASRINGQKGGRPKKREPEKSKA